MQSSTTLALEAAFVTAIHTITPRHVHARAERWKFTPCGRERGGRAEGLAGAALRSFDLIWSAGQPDYHFVGGANTGYSATLAVAVSYSGVPPGLLGHMITDDGVDLYRTLAALGEPTTPGLSHVLHLDRAEDIDDQSNALVEHRFSVHWSQDTSAT